MKVIVKSEEELLEVTKEALHVLNNLRYYTKAWRRNFGHHRKERKEYWENRADELLAKLYMGIKSANIQQIKIEINGSENSNEV